MGTTTGQNIVDRAAIILQDSSHVRWPETSELLLWINDAQREIVLRKPESSATNDSVVCVEGTKQSIPTSGIQLLDVVRNTGTDGLTPGRAVTRIDREILDEQVPTWHADTASATAKHFMFDKRDPTHFYVYPPQPSSGFGYLELVYSGAPTDLATLAGTISLNDVYSNVILDYVLYRAYSKDADLSPTGSQRAVAHYNAFNSSLGLKTQTDQIINPNAHEFREAQEAQAVGRG